MSYRWKPPDDLGPGPGSDFTCPDCSREFFVSASEAWPGLRPLCDTCVAIRNEQARVERARERTPLLVKR